MCERTLRSITGRAAGWEGWTTESYMLALYRYYIGVHGWTDGSGRMFVSDILLPHASLSPQQQDCCTLHRDTMAGSL